MKLPVTYEYLEVEGAPVETDYGELGHREVIAAVPLLGYVRHFFVLGLVPAELELYPIEYWTEEPEETNVPTNLLRLN